MSSSAVPSWHLMSESAKSKALAVAMWAYWLIGCGTFIKLCFFDDYAWTFWNSFIVVPINIFLSAIWPIYWGILRPLFGH